MAVSDSLPLASGQAFVWDLSLPLVADLNNHGYALTSLHRMFTVTKMAHAFPAELSQLLRDSCQRAHLICIMKAGFLAVPPGCHHPRWATALSCPQGQDPPTGKRPLKNRQSASHLQRPWPPLVLSSFHLSCWRKRAQVSEGLLYTPSQYVLLTHSHTLHNPEIKEHDLSDTFFFFKLKYSWFTVLC